MRAIIAALLLAALARPVEAQSEERIRAFFEGQTVRVKIDMPGSSEGVDVYPGTAQPIDYPKHASRLKRYGTAYHRGDEALVTKLRVKKDLIEFQLGGGGFGTFGDDDSPNVYVATASKTEREKNLERDLPKITDPAARRKMKEELDALKRDRQREDARNQAEAEQARQAKTANIRQRRLDGGSRFNLRYRPAVPEEALTPESIMQALADYLEFTSTASNDPGATPAPRGDAPDGGLRKGLTVDEVDALLGRPEGISQRMEGTLSVHTSIYRTRNRKITADFVEGVLVRFTITSP